MKDLIISLEGDALKKYIHKNIKIKTNCVCENKGTESPKYKNARIIFKKLFPKLSSGWYKPEFFKKANVQIVLWFALLVLALSGCLPENAAQKNVDDDTLQMYIRAQKIYAEGRFKDASQMLLNNPKTGKFTPALTLRGKAFYFSGDIEKAAADFRRVLKRRPTQTEAALFLARIYHEQGDEKKAVLIVENIISDDPSNVRALRLAAQLAESADGAGDKTASAYLNRAVEASGETALAFLDRGRFHWRSGRDEAALEDLRRAKALIYAQSPIYKTIENLENIIKTPAQTAGE